MALTQAQKDALLAQLGTGVKKTSVDGLSVESHSIPDIIQGLNYAASCDAVANGNSKRKPFRLNVLRSPGIGECRGRRFGRGLGR